MADATQTVNTTLSDIKIKRLFSYTPRLSPWLGKLNVFIKAAFHKNGSELYKLYSDTKIDQIDSGKYIFAISRLPEVIDESYKLELITEKLTNNPSFSSQSEALSNELLFTLYPLLQEIYNTEFAKISKTEEERNKTEIDRLLHLVSDELIVWYNKTPSLRRFAAYPYFVLLFLEIITLTFDLLQDLQENEWYQKNEAQKAALTAEREALTKDRQEYRDAHSRLTSSSRVGDDNTVREKYEEALKQQGRNDVFGEINNSLSRDGKATLSPQDIENVDKNLRAYVYENGGVPTTSEEWEVVFRGSQTSVSFTALQSSELDKLNDYANHIADNPVFQKLRQFPEETKGLRKDFAEIANDFGPHADLALYHVYGGKSDALQTAQDGGRISLEEANHIKALKQRLIQEELEELYRQNNEQIPEGGLTEEDILAFNDHVDGEGGLLNYLGFGGEEEEQTEETSEESDEKGSSSPSSPRKKKEKSPAPPSPAAQKKRMERVKKSLQTAKTFLSSPLGVGLATGAGIGGLTLYSLLTNGIGGAAVTGTMGAAGAIIGSAFGPIGTFLGGLAGSALSMVHLNLGSALPFLENVPLLGSHSLAEGGGSVFRSLTGTNISGAGGHFTGTATQTFSNASQVLGSVGKAGAGTFSKLAGAGVNGLTKVLPALSTGVGGIGTGSTIALVAGPIGGAAVIAAIITMASTAAFLTGGENSPCFSNDDLEICKSATPSESSDPTPVSYTIDIRAKNGANISIVSISDELSYQREIGSPADLPELQAPPTLFSEYVGKTIGSNESIHITYPIDFTSEFSNTRILNTVTVGYTTREKSDSLKANTTVVFGSVRSGAGCWPTNGIITQLPFDTTYSHDTADAIDIGAPSGEPVYTPFSGEAHFFNEDATSGYPIVRWGKDTAPYGTYLYVLADNGYKFFFAHLSKITHEPGAVVQVSAGEPVGEVGSTGHSTAPHLHYELKTSSGNPSSPGILTSFLPSTPEKRKTVSTTECGIGAAVPNTPSVGCFTFVNAGDKGSWKEEEIAFARPILEEVLSDPLRKKLICNRGGIETPISLMRVNSSPSDDGGAWSAYVSSDSSIEIYDTMFTNKLVYGASSLWHEPAHIIQLRHSGWRDLYVNAGPLLSTYPYRLTSESKKIQEDFAESFGMCFKTGFPTASVLPGYRDNPTIAFTQYLTKCSIMLQTLKGL